VADPAGLQVGAFDRDTAVHRTSEYEAATGAANGARFTATVSTEWRAGRGPHGGYLAAMLLRALTETVADAERAPRSSTIHYARAPKPGAVEIHTVVERAGRSLNTLSARLEQDGTLVALALAAFSVSWEAPELGAEELALPAVEPPDPVRDTPQWLLDRVEQGLAPKFFRQVVVQPRIGQRPFAGAAGPMEVGAWIGLRDEPRPIDAIALALFSDALFSPPFVRLTQPSTSPTIDLTVHFRTRLPRGPGAAVPEPPNLCFASFQTRLVHEGFFEEDGAIWAPDGTLLAQSRQLALLLPLRIG
jgi:acyl-CoA thioesterase